MVCVKNVILCLSRLSHKMLHNQNKKGLMKPTVCIVSILEVVYKLFSATCNRYRYLTNPIYFYYFRIMYIHTDCRFNIKFPNVILNFRSLCSCLVSGRVLKSADVPGFAAQGPKPLFGRSILQCYLKYASKGF